MIGKNESKINIDGLENGIYFLKITSQGISQTVKFTVVN